MDNFLNPAYTSSMQVTDVDKEIQRLYNQTGDGGVVPDRPQKYITVDGERVDLTGEQYVEYATKRGQTQFKLLEELLDSSLYRSLGDEEKTQAVSSVYNYADMLGKAAVSDYQPEDWVAEAQNAKKEFGISTSEYAPPLEFSTKWIIYHDILTNQGNKFRSGHLSAPPISSAPCPRPRPSWERRS